MKVALLTDGIWPFVIGGMQKHSYHLCRLFASMNVHVEIFHPEINQKDRIKSVFTSSELEFLHFSFVSQPVVPRFPGHYLLASYLYSKNLYKILAERKDFDLIYAKGLTAWYLLTHRHRTSVPVALNVHGYEYFQKSATLKNRLQQFLLRPPFAFINRKADIIFSYGPAITTIIKKNIKGITAKIIEIPAAVDPMYLNPKDPLLPSASRKFVFVGRYERRKGIEELLNVIKDNELRGEYTINVVGEMPRTVMEIAAKVIFHGRVDESERLMQILRESDVLICPSYAEGMPNVILEAMASGCAIIGTYVGAIPDLVDSTNGWLIPPGDEKALRDAIQLSIAEPAELLHAKKKRSIEKVRDKFTSDKVRQSYAQLFSQLNPSSTGNPRTAISAH